MTGIIKKLDPTIFFLLFLAISGCDVMEPLAIGNPSVPEPTKRVDLNSYLGRWYEIARYEASFQKGCEFVTANYSLKPDGRIKVINSCRRSNSAAKEESVTGEAYVIEGSGNTKLRVSFFWPFYGNYWILDYDPMYEWAIVGEPEGRYLWLLSRDPVPSDEKQKAIISRAAELGYDTSLLRKTRQ
jgi:apolipoprotein D and lipocalin family protein